MGLDDRNETVLMRAGWLLGACGLITGAALAALLGLNGLWVATAAAAILAAGAWLGGAGKLSSPSEPAQSGPGHAAIAAPELLRAVLEQLPDPLMLLDDADRVMLANSAMRAMIGTDVEDKTVSMALRTPAVLQAIDQTALTGDPSCAEFVFRVPVERHYQAYVARTPQSPHLTAVVFHDLTAVKRAEQARADFIANASHELRTPLAAVTGFIETLRGHARDDEAARPKFLEIMSLEAQRMRRLIDDLLSLTRIEQNEHVPPSGTVDLEFVIRDAAAALAPLAQLENVTIDIEAPPDLPAVTGARDELIQVFQNLIHNALKYGKTGGHITIALAETAEASGRRGGAMIAASVRDEGEGIPREAIPRLTERFYRVDVKRSRERGGTGLGLAIVKHIVNRHQGRLVIDSTPGEGSTFTVLLPARSAALPASVMEVL
jgi:two-component system phosphate regulon sensor histidine kinase PhoR